MHYQGRITGEKLFITLSLIIQCCRWFGCISNFYTISYAVSRYQTLSDLVYHIWVKLWTCCKGKMIYYIETDNSMLWTVWLYFKLLHNKLGCYSLSDTFSVAHMFKTIDLLLGQNYGCTIIYYIEAQYSVLYIFSFIPNFITISQSALDNRHILTTKPYNL